MFWCGQWLNISIRRFGTLLRSTTQAAHQVEGKTVWMSSLMRGCSLNLTQPLERPTDKVTHYIESTNHCTTVLPKSQTTIKAKTIAISYMLYWTKLVHVLFQESKCPTVERRKRATTRMDVITSLCVYQLSHHFATITICHLTIYD